MAARDRTTPELGWVPRVSTCYGPAAPPSGVGLDKEGGWGMPSLPTRLTVLAAALGALLAVSGTAFGADSAQPLDMYGATVDARTAAKLARDGYDLGHGPQRVAGGVQVELVLTTRQADRLRGQGIDVKPIRNGNGQTVREQAEAMAASGYQVYRSYDEAGGIRDELYDLAKRNPNLVKLVVLGRTVQGREIIALKVTRNARQLADGSRPDVLYMGTIHRASGSRPRSRAASFVTTSTTTPRTRS